MLVDLQSIKDATLYYSFYSRDNVLTLILNSEANFSTCENRIDNISSLSFLFSS